jgi:hypothetical protein
MKIMVEKRQTGKGGFNNDYYEEGGGRWAGGSEEATAAEIHSTRY